MIAIPYVFQDYTIKPKVMRIIPDQSGGAIPVIQKWVVLKDGVEISTPVFRKPQGALEWIKQQSQTL